MKSREVGPVTPHGTLFFPELSENRYIKIHTPRGRLYIPEGTDILLVDFLVGNGAIEEKSYVLSATNTEEPYESPFIPKYGKSMATNVKIGKNGSLYVSTAQKGRMMTLSTFGNSMFLASLNPFDSGYSIVDVPGGPEDYPWARKVDDPQRLKDAYTGWLADQKKQRTEPFPVEGTLLGKEIILFVNERLATNR